MLVLGIETSCDETGVALYDSDRGLLAHVLYSQIKLHAAYGGVVPELASRDHAQRLVLLIRQALAQAGVSKADLDGIAYTAGPGLVGALMVGASVAQGLALGLNIPTMAVHHMEGHLLAPLLEPAKPHGPFVALLVSGGHTQLYRVDAIGQYTLLGESIDDAAGEAFDKTAKLMGLPYPGGPHLAKLAEQGKPGQFKLPRPMTDRPGFDFSFSGLKTAVLHALQHCQTEQNKADLAADFQIAVVDTLLRKTQRALQYTGLTQLVVAGGVSANVYLRETLAQAAQQHGWQVFYPHKDFCTDNGAMIAYAGALRLLAGQQSDHTITVKARWPMADLPSLADPSGNSLKG